MSLSSLRSRTICAKFKIHLHNILLYNSTYLICKAQRVVLTIQFFIMTFLSRVKVVVFGLVLLVTGFVGTICVNGVLLPLFFLRPRWYRTLFDLFNGLWEWQAAFLLEKFIGMEVEITGDQMLSSEQSVIIMNHRTCFDWMYFWSVLIRQSGLLTEKVIVKSSLRHLPGPGWAMQSAAFIFVNRKWDEDERHLKMMIDYFAAISYKTQILIFPEGTDFNAKSKQRSDIFAEKNSLQPYSYLLHPRTTGFTFLVSSLLQSWQNIALYDITIAFSSSFPQNEAELFKGILPSKVHFHINRFSPTQILEAKDKLVEWCKDRWDEKEHRLKYFYKNGRFPDDSNQLQSSEQSNISYRKIWLDVCLYLVTIAWLGCTALAIVSFLWWPLVRFALTAQVLLFLFLWYRGSGLDVLQVMYFNHFYAHSVKHD